MTHSDNVPHLHGFQWGLQENFLRLPDIPLPLGISSSEKGSCYLTMMLGTRRKKPAARTQKIHYFCSRNCYFLISLLSHWFSPIQIPTHMVAKSVIVRSEGNNQQKSWPEVAKGCGQARCKTGYPKGLKGKTQTDICTSMFIAALFRVAKRQKNPKCPSMGEWLNKMWYTHTRILFSHEKLWNSNTCYNMANLKTLCYMEDARQKRTNIVWFCLGWWKRFGNR